MNFHKQFHFLDFMLAVNKWYQFAEYSYDICHVFQVKFMWRTSWSPYKINMLSNSGWNSSLTHWGRVMHICVSKLNIIGSDNGLLHGRCQAITWTNANLLSIGPLETNFSEILIEILTFLFIKMHLNMSSVKWWPFCSGDELTHGGLNKMLQTMPSDEFSGIKMFDFV